MLVTFFKSRSDIKSKCVITKYVDRIWVEKDGNLNCIRTFILHVEDGEPLHEIRMLTPFRNTPKLTDLCHTCLDPNYLFNNTNFSSGGYRIQSVNPEGTCGQISYDYFNTTVYTENQIKSFSRDQCKAYEVIAFNFRTNPISKGEYRLIRLSFSVTSVLDRIQSRVSSIRLEYFRIPSSDEFNMMDIKNLEVPVLKIYEPTTKQGGFDIFLQFPSDSMESLNLGACTFTTTNHLFNASLSDVVFHKLIWRARFIFPDESVRYLKAAETAFSVEGLIGDPKELDEIRSEVGTIKADVNDVKSHLDRVVKGLGNARWIAISGVIIAFISLIISCLKYFYYK